MEKTDKFTTRLYSIVGLIMLMGYAYAKIEQGIDIPLLFWLIPVYLINSSKEDKKWLKEMFEIWMKNKK